jgi:hypothetical protein
MLFMQLQAQKQYFNQLQQQQAQQQQVQAPMQQDNNSATNPASTSSSGSQPQESSGMTGPTWAATPGNQRANGSGQTNAYPAGSSGEPAPREAAFMPPSGSQQNPMMAALAQTESGGDPNALSSKGAAGTYQIMPSTARDPGYGVQPLQGWDGKDPRTASPQEQQRFANDYLNAVQNQVGGGNPQLGAAAYNAGPGRVQQALNGLPQETQDYVQKVAGPTANTQQPQQQQQAIVNPLFGKAPPNFDQGRWNDLNMRAFARMPGAQQQLDAIMKSAYEPISARQNSVDYIPATGVAATGRYEWMDQSGREHVSEPKVTGPNGEVLVGQTPGQTLGDLGPGEHEQIKNEMEFHTNGEHGELKSYNAAVGSQQNLTQLQSYIDTLNAHQGDANFLASGAGAEMRTEGAKMLNTAWSMAGGDPKDAPFDVNKVSAAEASYKTANLLGMQLINSQFGASREAASVIQTGLKSVPSMENTPQGAKLLLNGAKEVSNNTMDRYTFKEWWARPDGPHPGDLRGADVAFNQAFPPQLYAKRAISQEQPIDISGLKAPPNLLPGTVIRYGNQPPKIVPQTQQLPEGLTLPSISGQTK